MYPIKLEFENVGPYRGAHAIDLTDSVYAVTARHERNPERSNWLGKTSLLWLVPYALNGSHPAKTDNDWVHNGTDRGCVVLHLSDGTRVERCKVRGKSEQLEVRLPNGTPLTQKAAQEALDRHIGLSKDDFMATCFYRQKQLSRMVDASSADRIEMVESWLASDLAPIQRMHAHALDDLAAANKELSAKVADVAAIRGDTADMVTEYGVSDVKALPRAIVDRLAAKDRAIRDTTQYLEGAKRKRLAAESWKAKVEAAAEFDAIVAEGQRLRVELDGLPASLEDDRVAAEARVADAALVAASATQEHRRLAGLKRGEFGGQCPVNGGQCPSRDWVTSIGVSPAEVARASAATQSTQAALSAARATLAQLNSKLARKGQLEGKLEALREQAATLVDVANEVADCIDPPDVPALDALVRQREGELAAATAAREATQTDQRWLTSATQSAAKLEAEVATINERRALLAEAVQLLGKTGAQQKLGEIALAKVEQGANDMLASAGVDLTVSVRWVSHLQGLARHCDSCGTAYTGSDRVKVCPACGAKRGPNVAAKLVIDLSNRSGAAEDLAGIAVGLAASEWLRAKRASGWSAVFIDEPFGALDAHHKRALSVHVATLLRRSFRAAFVVAHDKSVLDALPSRLTIIGTDNGSKVETGEQA